MLIEPIPVGLLGGDLLLNLLIGDNPALIHIHQEHAAGFEPPLVGHPLGLDGQNPGFRRHDHQVVLGDRVAGGAETVAVKHCPHHGAVGECDRRRAIPGLHQTGVVLVKRLFLSAHRLVGRPGLGHHHHHGVGQGAAR